MNAPRDFIVYTAEGTSFTATGRSLRNALDKSASELLGFTPLAIVDASCVVTPAAGELTALIVRQGPPLPPV